ncbi:hypothetical protein GYA19_05300 [Candidatus Beckwithbacteria bacterium]|nr:hypothetical protein [Candidatus Beckwithbacteria bacterium]
MLQKKKEQRQSSGTRSLGQILETIVIDNKERRYVSREFQDYGYRLTIELGEDPKKASLYIKLAKETDRSLIENARSFVMDAKNVKSKARLFMWKLNQLKTQK